MRKIKYFLVSLVSLFLVSLSLVSCTRPENRNSSQIKIQIPTQMNQQSKLGTLSTLAASHVVINVTGPGLAAPLVVSWDRKRQVLADINQVDQILEPPPLNLEIPKGEGRLFQAVVVYEDLETRSMAFYYGETLKALTANDESVAIDLNKINTTGEALETANVAGRILNTSGSGPTGEVRMLYFPPNNRPPMEIERSYITNGWFGFFLTNTIPFSFEFIPERRLLFSNVTMSSPQFQPSSNKVAVIKVPESIRMESGSNSSNQENEIDEARTFIIGFFGDSGTSSASIGGSICYQDGAYTYYKKYSIDSATGSAYEPLTYSIQNFAGSTPSLADKVTLYKTTATSACASTASLSESVIPILPELLSEGGGSYAAGFTGVFKLHKNNDYYSSIERRNLTASEFKLALRYLPGTTTLYDNILAFRAPIDFEGGGDFVNCEAMQKNETFFERLGSFPVAIGADGAHEITLPMIPAPWTIALCPAKGERTFNAGVMLPSRWFSGSGGGGDTTGGGGSSGPTVEVNGFDLMPTIYQVGLNQCIPTYVHLRSSDNGNPTNSVNRNFSISSPGGVVYDDIANCILGNASNISSFTIPASELTKLLYVRTSGSPVNVNLTVTETDFGSKSQNLSVASTGSVTSFTFHNDNIKIGSNQCSEVIVFFTDSNNRLATIGSASSLNLSKQNLGGTPVNDFSVFANCQSTTQITSIPVAAGDYFKTFAIKNSGNISDRKIAVSASLPAFSKDILINITPTVQSVSININNGQPVYEGSCSMMQVSALDMNSSIPTFAFPLSVFMSGSQHSAGELKNNCLGSNHPNPFSYPASVANYNLYYIAGKAQTSVNLNPGSPYLYQSQNQNLQIFPVPAASRATLKLHLTSDQIPPGVGSLTEWYSIDTNALTSGANSPHLTSPDLLAISLISGEIPKNHGLLLPSTASYLNKYFPVAADQSVSATILIKFESLPTANAPILTLKDSVPTFYDLIGVAMDGGTAKFKGMHSGFATPIVAGTWYAITYNLYYDGANNRYNLHITPQGQATENFTGTFGTPGTLFGALDYLKITPPTTTGMRIKAVIMDLGATNQLPGDYISDHSYLFSRLPN